MRYAELTIVGSLAFAVAASLVGDKGGTRAAGAGRGCEAAAPARVDIATAARAALAAAGTPEGDRSVVGARRVLAGVRPAWEVSIAHPSRPCVAVVLVDAESGELLFVPPELEPGR